MTIFKCWDVVEVPFPFIDVIESKKRKALVISSLDFNQKNKALVLCMITSAQGSQWLGDTEINDLKVAGLKKKCFLRLKIFTLPEDQVIRRAGTLSERDRKAFRKSLGAHVSVNE